MKIRLTLSACLAIVTWFAYASPAEAQSAVISGVLRNPDGVAISGARATISADSPAAPAESTTSAATGEFRFEKLPAGTFTLSIQAAGYANASRQIKISADDSVLRADFTLARADASPANQTNAANASAPPSFQAAGVRGLIDAGGYSAAANGAAATGLIKGMADIRRADDDPDSAAAKSLPCAIEPELRAAVDHDPNGADANRKLGEFYLAHGQSERAIPYFETARRHSAGDTASAKDLALALIKSGKFRDARDLLSDNSAPDDPEIRSLLARADEGSGMFIEASQQYRAAAQLVPSEENFFGVGYELILAGRPSEAGVALRTGLDRFPNSVRLLIGAGASEFLLGNRAAGVEQLLLATKIAATDPRPYRFLVSTVATSGDQSGAIRDAFKRHLDIVPDDPDANYDYAFSLWSARTQDTSAPELAKIEALLHRSIELRPDFARAHLQLANLYFERQDYRRAAPEYEAALRGEPDSSEIHYRLARTYQYTGQTDLAAQQMRAFESTRNQNSAQGGGAGITIEQFISVISSGHTRTAANLACNAAAAP